MPTWPRAPATRASRGERWRWRTSRAHRNSPWKPRASGTGPNPIHRRRCRRWRGCWSARAGWRRPSRSWQSCWQATARPPPMASCSWRACWISIRTSRPTCGWCARWRRAIPSCRRRIWHWRRRRWLRTKMPRRSPKRAAPRSCGPIGRPRQSSRRRCCSAGRRRWRAPRSHRSSRSIRSRARRGSVTRDCWRARESLRRRARNSKSCWPRFRTTATCCTR